MVQTKMFQINLKWVHILNNPYPVIKSLLRKLIMLYFLNLIIKRIKNDKGIN